jgi:lipopolysaccharide export LptBFGC system permease protein LptF
MKSGRFWASERLGINPITYYKILKRLEKKYDLVTLKSNNKNTTILVNKWHAYQDQSNNESNNQVTTKEQQSNTTQELRIKNKENIYRYIDSLNEETIGVVADKYSVSTENVADLAETLKLYCQSKGKKYANYKAALMEWTRRAIKEGRISKKTKGDDYVARLNAASK